MYLNVSTLFYDLSLDGMGSVPSLAMLEGHAAKIVPCCRKSLNSKSGHSYVLKQGRLLFVRVLGRKHWIIEFCYTVYNNECDISWINHWHECGWHVCLCMLAIKLHSPEKPALIFVSSRRQTRLTALDLIAFLAADDNPKQWLHMPESEVWYSCRYLAVGSFHLYSRLRCLSGWSVQYIVLRNWKV